MPHQLHNIYPKIDSTLVLFFHITPRCFGSKVLQCIRPIKPKMIFVSLIDPHYCWMTKQLSPNFPYKPIKMRGEKKYPFSSQLLIVPLEETFMPLHLVYKEEYGLITCDPKLPTIMKLYQETQAYLPRHPSIEGKAVKKSTHIKIYPNIPR